MFTYIRVFLCLCVCVLPYGYILTEPRTTGTRVRFLHVLLKLLQPSPKHIRDDDNNGATHREAAEMRRLLVPDMEAKPRVLLEPACFTAPPPSKNERVCNKIFKMGQNQIKSHYAQ